MSTAIVAIPVPTGKAQASATVKHLKVSLNEDTRRFSVNDDSNKFAQLVVNVREVYSLSADSALLFKYKDEEGDLISVSSEAELAEGFRVVGDAPLRLLVSVTAAAPAADVVVQPMLRLAPATPIAVPKVRACPKGHQRRAPVFVDNNIKINNANAASAPNVEKTEKVEKVEAKKEPKAADPKIALLKERNQALKERCEQFKQRMQALKAAREAGVLQVATLQRDLQFVRAEKCPRIKAVLARGRFVCDVTVPDGTTLSPGEIFTKTWRFRNDSDVAWPAGTRLLFVGKNSDRMGAPDEVLVQREVPPTTEIDISVPLTAPNAAGRYVTYFRLAGADQVKFGQRVWCSVVVKEASSSSSDEEACNAPNAAPAADADMIKFQHQLQVLAEMNLTNLRLNVRLLNKFDGNLEHVVERLFARKAKWAARAAANPDAAAAAGAHPHHKFAARGVNKMEEKLERKVAKMEERLAWKAEKLAAKVEKKAEKECKNNSDSKN